MLYSHVNREKYKFVPDLGEYRGNYTDDPVKCGISMKKNGSILLQNFSIGGYMNNELTHEVSKETNEFFPLRPEACPMIYAYEDSNPDYKELLKVGYTTIDVEQRVAQQYPTKRPDGKIPYRIVFKESAMYADGGNFCDHDIHRALAKRGFPNVGGEWFKCTVDDIRSVYSGSQWCREC